ncbi:MAG: DUF2269 domain-containing protein [Ignavibacteriae bacterium]|nr:DUF2269 domain-containing protein [Ignavibacteriota bacterium]
MPRAGDDSNRRLPNKHNNEEDKTVNGSYNFLLHLLGFGVFTAVYLRSVLFEKTLRAEPDWTRKTLIMNIMNTGAWLGPVSGIVLLLSGFGNVYNRYLGAPEPVQFEGWIAGKLILFIILMINGVTMGRILSKRRFQLVHASAKEGPSPDNEQKLRQYNGWLTVFYLIQGLLLLAITSMAAFGSLKHPGAF